MQVFSEPRGRRTAPLPSSLHAEIDRYGVTEHLAVDAYQKMPQVPGPGPLRQWVKEKLAAHFHLPLMMATVRRVAGQTEELPEIESIHYALQPERESIKLLIQFEGLAEPIEYPIHESEIECLEINPRPIMNLIREDLLQALEEAKVK